MTVEALECRELLDATYHSLAGGAFAQDWTNTNPALQTNNDWSGVASIIGYRGDGLTATADTDPRTVLSDGTGTPISIVVNQSPPVSTGGVLELPSLPNPTVALQSSTAAAAPFLLFHIDSTGVSGVRFSCNLRDLDASGDNSAQQVVVQYRVGTTGEFSNVPGGYVADASTGPSQATLVTPVSVVLPPDANNQTTLQIRVMTTRASGGNEIIGVDDIVIDQAPALPTLTINDVSLAEGNAGATTFSFTVSLSAPAGPGSVTFDIATADNTATAASGDYVARTLAARTIPQGSSTFSFDVTVNGDTSVEPSETFFVNVTSVVGATVVDGQGQGTIQNDDAAPAATLAIAASSADKPEGNSGTTAFTFTVTRGVNTAGTTSVNFAVTGSGANPAAVNDFAGGAFPSGTVTFLDGETSKDITINVAGDTLFETDETFTVTLSNPGGGATITTAAAGGTIRNDDEQQTTVTAITRANPSPTGAASVSWSVTFADGIVGLSATNFNLVRTGGVGGAAITGVAGSAAGWTVTASTGTGDGTIGLDLVTDAGVVQRLTNLPFAGEVYTIDKTPPAVLAFASAVASPTNADTVAFDLTFDGAVANVTDDDFTLAGPAGATLSVSGSGATYTATVSIPAGAVGSLAVTLKSGTDITDPAGNPFAGSATSNTVVVDRDPPAVQSVALASTNPLLGSGLSAAFTVTFDGPVLVSSVDPADFTAAVMGTVRPETITVAQAGTGPTDATFTVTVTGLSGSGTLELTVPATATITDAAGNTLDGLPFDTGAAYDVNPPGPEVSSVALVGTPAANAASVTYAVTFSQPVQTATVSDADFGLVFTGTTTGTITSAAPVSSSGGLAMSFTVTVGSVAGEGTLRLDLTSTDIQNAGGQSIPDSVPFAGEVHAVDTVAPTVVSITPELPSMFAPTNAAQVTFTVTFSEAVVGVGEEDFSPSGSAVAGASVAGVTGSGTTYTVTVNTGTDGPLTLSLSSPGGVADPAGNAVAGTFTGPVGHQIDKTAPRVTSVSRVDPDPTNADAVRFRVVFSEGVSVTSLDAGDFAVLTTGTVRFEAVTVSAFSDPRGSFVLPVSGVIVTVSGVAGDGTLRLDVPDTATIQDLAGNGVTAVPFTAGEAYTIDNTPPRVVSIVPQASTVTNAGLVRFRVEFSEPVTGVGAGDFALARTGTAGGVVTSVTGSGAVYVVTVANITGSGTLRLDVPAAASLTDAAGNPFAGTPFAGQAVTADRVRPTATVTRVGGTPTSVVFTVRLSEPVALGAGSFRVVTSGSVAGAAVAAVTGGGRAFTVTMTTASGSGTVALRLVTGVDVAGNAVVPVTSAAVAIDRTAPRVAGITRLDPEVTNAATVRYRVTFSEAVAGVTGNAFAVIGPAGAAVVGVSGSGADYVVTVATGTGDGPLALAVAGGIRDAAGNLLSGRTAGPGYAIDKTAPQVVALEKLDADPTGAATVRYRVTFSEAVTLPAAALAVAAEGLGGTPAVVAVEGGGTAFVVTLSTGLGSGSLGLTVGSGVADAAGNALAAAATGPAYAVERVVPVSTLVALGADAGSLPVVRVIDPATGATVRQILALPPQFTGGVRAASADLTGDGVEDVVVAAGPGGGPVVSVFDGVTGELVTSFFAYASVLTSGVYVAAGDVTGDGRADIVTGAGPGGGPHVKVFDGVTGAEVRSFMAFGALLSGGVTVAAGDVDGDGFADVVAGAGPGGGTVVSVFDGADLTLLASWLAFGDGTFTGGVFVAAGDTDGDGRAEVAVGPGAGGGPVAYLFDGTSGLLRRGWAAFDSSTLQNGARVAIVDAGGDGLAEIVAGTGPGSPPRARVFGPDAGLRLDLPLPAEFLGGVFVG